jgi:hypothetical protein
MSTRLGFRYAGLFGEELRQTIPVGVAIGTWCEMLAGSGHRDFWKSASRA